jgi:hypothetical protein
MAHQRHFISSPRRPQPPAWRRISKRSKEPIVYIKYMELWRKGVRAAAIAKSVGISETTGFGFFSPISPSSLFLLSLSPLPLRHSVQKVKDGSRTRCSKVACRIGADLEMAKGHFMSHRLRPAFRAQPHTVWWSHPHAQSNASTTQTRPREVVA